MEMGVVNRLEPRRNYVMRVGFDFMTTLLKDRYQNQVFLHAAYPAKCRKIFREKKNFGVRADSIFIWRDEILRDWHDILEIVKKAPEYIHFATLLKQVSWRRWPFVRMTFCRNELELTHHQRTSFLHTMRGCTECWGDSRGSEDVHKEHRTASTKSANGQISHGRLYRTQIRVQGPAKRKMTVSSSLRWKLPGGFGRDERTQSRIGSKAIPTVYRRRCG